MVEMRKLTQRISAWVWCQSPEPIKSLFRNPRMKARLPRTGKLLAHKNKNSEPEVFSRLDDNIYLHSLIILAVRVFVNFALAMRVC